MVQGSLNTSKASFIQFFVLVILYNHASNHIQNMYMAFD